MEQNPALQDQIGQFYIKRLVVLGGEKVRIGGDRHLVINGERLDRSTPGFERVYSFDPSVPPHESQYSGHVNSRSGPPWAAPLFPDESVEREVPAHHYMVMGDNTINSSDSRTWGSFPQENVIGRSWFVYWPIGKQEGRQSRFGGATR
jgi:signal peptidase I